MDAREIKTNFQKIGINFRFFPINSCRKRKKSRMMLSSTLVLLKKSFIVFNGKLKRPVLARHCSSTSHLTRNHFFTLVISILMFRTDVLSVISFRGFVSLQIYVSPFLCSPLMRQPWFVYSTKSFIIFCLFSSFILILVFREGFNLVEYFPNSWNVGG